MECNTGGPCVSETSSKQDLDDELQWLESSLSSFLDKHSKILRVSPFSKRWWNEDVAEARKVWAQAKKTYQGKLEFKDELRQTQNTYYRIIRQAKPACWQKFLQGQNATKGTQDDKNRCWTTL